MHVRVETDATTIQSENLVVTTMESTNLKFSSKEDKIFIGEHDTQKDFREDPIRDFESSSSGIPFADTTQIKKETKVCLCNPTNLQSTPQCSQSVERYEAYLYLLTSFFILTVAGKSYTRRLHEQQIAEAHRNDYVYATYSNHKKAWKRFAEKPAKPGKKTKQYPRSKQNFDRYRDSDSETMTPYTDFIGEDGSAKRSIGKGRGTSKFSQTDDRHWDSNAETTLTNTEDRHWDSNVETTFTMPNTADKVDMPLQLYTTADTEETSRYRNTVYCNPYR